MKRLSQNEFDLMVKEYGRYGQGDPDYVTLNTCLDIIEWMCKEKDYDDVFLVVGKKGNFVQVRGRDGVEKLEREIEELRKKRVVRHKRKTIERCLNMMVENMEVR